MKTRGFSLVELLTVIVVLVILASLTTLFISNWRDSAAETEVKNDLVNAVSAVESYSNYNSGYPANQASFDSLYTNTKTVDLDYTRRLDGSFCINAASNVRTGIVWNVDSSVSKSPRSGSC